MPMSPSTILFLDGTLATIYVTAAAAKVGRTERLQTFLVSIGLPASISTTTASLTALLELAVGAALIVGVGTLPMATMAVLVSMVFVAVQVVARWRGVSVDCGCFGRLDPDEGTGIELVRGLAVVLIAAALTVETAGYGGGYLWASFANSLPAFSGGIAAAIALIVSTSLLAQVQAFETRRPRATRLPKLDSAEAIKEA
jgi:uncharacterized membrane protein YphA (DoxX/SURF4 family)